MDGSEGGLALQTGEWGVGWDGEELLGEELAEFGEGGGVNGKGGEEEGLEG